VPAGRTEAADRSGRRKPGSPSPARAFRQLSVLAVRAVPDAAVFTKGALSYKKDLWWTSQTLDGHWASLIGIIYLERKRHGKMVAPIDFDLPQDAARITPQFRTPETD
jgi:hypothetical protein